jgi:ComEC/Rec2-related protein
VNASPLRQRLPCVALLAAALAGIAVGRLVDAPGWLFALVGAIALPAALLPRLSIALWPGVACAFAAFQTWQYRESPAAALAAGLDHEWRVCEATLRVDDVPRLTTGGCVFNARIETLRIGTDSWRPRCTAFVRWEAEPPDYGSRFAVRASIRNVPPPRNPGELDLAAWLANNGIRSELQVLHAADATLLSTGGNPIVRFANAARSWIERTLAIDIAGTEEFSLLLGMTIGDTADIPERVEDDFRETGTFHLFSVSGLHVGIVAVFLWFVFGATGIDRRRVVLLLIPCLFFYALITGLKPASVRAAAMLSIIAAGLVIDRWPTALNTLGAAGLAILLVDTNQLFNPGFQLSFSVVASILLLAVPVMNRLAPFFEPDPFLPSALLSPMDRAARQFGKWVISLFAVSFSAWLGSLPLTLAYFHLISFTGIPTNLLVVPLASLVLATASLSLAAGVFSAWLAGVFNNAAWLACRLTIAIVTVFASIPGGSRYVGVPEPPGTVATLTVFDAHRGGSSLLTAGSGAWLIDTGSAFFADSVVVPFLRMSGVNTLDGLVLTHGDSGHLGGFERVESAVPIRRILDSGLPSRSQIHRHILNAVDPTRLTAATTGLRETIGPATTLEVLFPPADFHEPIADDKAVVLRIDAGSFSALLLSDAGAITERWLLTHKADRLPCDLVVMGRHISGHSGSLEFLTAVRPRAVIAAVADFPPSQIPRADWLRAVKDAGILVLRQDETGAVTVRIRHDTFTLTPFLDPSVSHVFPNDPVR